MRVGRASVYLVIDVSIIVDPNVSRRSHCIKHQLCSVQACSVRPGRLSYTQEITSALDQRLVAGVACDTPGENLWDPGISTNLGTVTILPTV